MNIYLKVNSFSYIHQMCIFHWLETTSQMQDTNLIVICDREEIIRELSQIEGLQIIGSMRNSAPLKEITEAVASDRWKMAAYAHLTTFLHAHESGCDAFWNIDADDTYPALSPEALRVLLEDAEQTALSNNIHAFSLDMHVSRMAGNSWSFGITYTDNRVDWIGTMRSYLSDYLPMKDTLEHISNLDWYFTFLKHHSTLSLESFYAENLLFVHLTSDYLMYYKYGGVYQWKNGRYLSPVIGEVLHAGHLGDIPIHPSVIKLAAEADEDESARCLRALFRVNPDTSCSLLEPELCEKVRPFLSTDETDEPEKANLQNESTVSATDESDPFFTKLSHSFDTFRRILHSGKEIYDNIQAIRPSDTHVIVCPGHMGDTLWDAALAGEYLRQKDCHKVWFAIHESQNEVIRMFPDIDSTICLDSSEMHDLQVYMLDMGFKKDNPIVYAHYKATIFLHGYEITIQQYTNYTTMLQTRKEFLGLTGDVKPSRIILPDGGNNAELDEMFSHAVLIIPVSQSMFGIPDAFWKAVADTYRSAGFEVFTNYNGFEYEKMIEGTTPLSSTLTELAQIAPHFAQVIAHRSGACDLIAGTEANLSIVYNTRYPDRDIRLTREDYLVENIYDLVDRDRLLNYQYIEGRDQELIDALLAQSTM